MANGSDALRALRGMLGGMLALGVVGTLAELFLLEHTEDLWQLIPVVLLPVGVVALIAVTLKPGVVTLQIMQTVMGLIVVSGVLGVYLHYVGNAEFEREMYASIDGFELFWESLKGATPALAPGAMTLIGLLGLAYCWVAGQVRAEVGGDHQGRAGAR
jgi:hypothetical protein